MLFPYSFQLLILANIARQCSSMEVADVSRLNELISLSNSTFVNEQRSPGVVTYAIELSPSDGKEISSSGAMRYARFSKSHLELTFLSSVGITKVEVDGSRVRNIQSSAAGPWIDHGSESKAIESIASDIGYGDPLKAISGTLCAFPRGTSVLRGISSTGAESFWVLPGGGNYFLGYTFDMQDHRLLAITGMTAPRRGKGISICGTFRFL